MGIAAACLSGVGMMLQAMIVFFVGQDMLFSSEGRMYAHIHAHVVDAIDRTSPLSSMQCLFFTSLVTTLELTE